MKGKEIGILRLAQLRVEDGIHGVNRGTAIGVDGVTGEKRCLFEIILAN